jgi:hypothetical protein
MIAIKVLQRANEAYNTRDADGLAATYAEGATYKNPHVDITRHPHRSVNGRNTTYRSQGLLSGGFLRSGRGR